MLSEAKHLSPAPNDPSNDAGRATIGPCQVIRRVGRERREMLRFAQHDGGAARTRQTTARARLVRTVRNASPVVALDREAGEPRLSVPGGIMTLSSGHSSRSSRTSARGPQSSARWCPTAITPRPVASTPGRAGARSCPVTSMPAPRPLASWTTGAVMAPTTATPVTARSSASISLQPPELGDHRCRSWSMSCSATVPSIPIGRTAFRPRMSRSVITSDSARRGLDPTVRRRGCQRVTASSSRSAA